MLTPRPLRSLLTVSLVVVATLAVGAQSISNKDLLDGLANPSRWLTYSGDYSGRRHSPLTQITPANAGQLTAQWTFQTAVGGKFEATPIVVDGVLYVTGPQNCAWAIDGRTGKEIWRYQRPVPQDVKACCGLVNRGFAVYGDRLFMATLDAHLVALDMKTGKVVWDVEIADYKQGYASTPAPLIVKDKVIVGIAGGEFAIRGFLDAYDVNTGKRAWRFWTIPAPGEPGSETWPATAWERGGAPTWLSGSYDPGAQPAVLGHRQSESRFLRRQPQGRQPVLGFAHRARCRHRHAEVALPVHAARHARLGREPDSGAGGPDDRRRSRARPCMVANRNGFLYVLDRTTGTFISAKPFVHQTWAKEIAADGRPVEVPDQRPTCKGHVDVPRSLRRHQLHVARRSTRRPGLLYVSARETCQIYISRSAARRL